MTSSNTIILAVAGLIAVWLLTRKQAPASTVTGLAGVPAPSAGAVMAGLDKLKGLGNRQPANVDYLGNPTYGCPGTGMFC